MLHEVRTTSCGHLVLVTGEAGVGKTPLYAAFARSTPSARILWGACDALFTPRPLGPPRHRGGRRRRAAHVAAAAPPHEVAAALMHELRGAPTVARARGPALGRRGHARRPALARRRSRAVARAPLATYRDDELGRAIRCASCSASWPPRGRSRCGSAALAASGRGARRAARRRRRRAYRRRRATRSSSPRCCAGGVGVPPTVRDAVLARAARLDPSARTLLDAAAVVRARSTGAARGAAGDALERLEECLASGMLTATAGGVAFGTSWRGGDRGALAPHRRLASTGARSPRSPPARRRADRAARAPRRGAATPTRSCATRPPPPSRPRRRRAPAGGRPVRARHALRPRAARASAPSCSSAARERVLPDRVATTPSRRSSWR